MRTTASRAGYRAVVVSCSSHSALGVEYYDWKHLGSGSSLTRYGARGLGIGAIYVGARGLWYAVTGQNNINRDYRSDL